MYKGTKYKSQKPSRKKQYNSLFPKPQVKCIHNSVGIYLLKNIL